MKFFCLPHKPVLQPFSLEMENGPVFKFSQHYFCLTEIPRLITWAWGRLFKKGFKKKKERQSIPFPLLRKTVYFSHDGKESKSE